MNNNKCPKCGRKMIWIEDYISLDGFWRCKNKKCETIYQTRLDILLKKFKERHDCLEYDLGEFDEIDGAKIEYKNNKFTIANYYLYLPISLSIAEDLIEYLSRPIK